jgi:hypothetical protein
MQMNKEIQFEEIVMLLDATYLDALAGQLRTALAPRLGRELPAVDLSTLLECMALDGGIRPLEDEAQPRRIQALFIYDQQSPRLQHLQPVDLNNELNDKAFRSSLGEFVLNSYPSSEFATRTDFYLEALKLMTDSKEVKQILALPDEACSDAVKAELEKGTKASTPKESKIFGFRPIDAPMFETVVFAMARALGMKSEEF